MPLLDLIIGSGLGGVVGCFYCSFTMSWAAIVPTLSWKQIPLTIRLDMPKIVLLVMSVLFYAYFIVCICAGVSEKKNPETLTTLRTTLISICAFDLIDLR